MGRGFIGKAFAGAHHERSGGDEEHFGVVGARDGWGVGGG
jgi:hypothetical protein